jgi:DNA-binding MarR family transcriptional regulator
MTHPAVLLDDTIHQRVRLGILAVLLESRRADFAYLRDALELTDGNLSQHLRVLEESGYVEIAKTFEGKKTRTWVAATKAGRSALASELFTLRALLKQVEKQTRS